MAIPRQYRSLWLVSFSLVATFTYWRLMVEVANEQLPDIPDPSPFQADQNQIDLQRWWHQRVDSIARAWDEIPHTNWCRPSQNGLLFIKVPKTSSSTCAGINDRIARKVGERALAPQTRAGTSHNKTAICGHSSEHGEYRLFRRTVPSILWTFLRDPAKRALSHYFHFQVSRKGANSTDRHIIGQLGRLKSYQFDYIAKAKDPYHIIKNSNDPFSHMQSLVMDHYDFIGLMERQVESLVLMKILWHLKTSDLVVLSSKRSGDFDDGQYKNTCVRIIKPGSLSPRVQKYLQYDFPRMNHDYLLLDIVNRSIDKTIEAVGRERVDKEVRLLRAAQAHANRKCQSEAIFPCSADGVLQTHLSEKNCYVRDRGCGFACVDRVLEDDSKIPDEFFSQ